MADYTVDLSAIATANPWTPSAPLKKGSTANLQLVNGSGAKSASGGSVSYGVHDVNYTLGSTQIRAEVDIGTVVFASDRVGPAIIARSGANAGAGYAALPDNYGGIYVYTVSAAGALTQIGYIGSITLAANDLIGLGYQQSTNTLTVYQNGTSKTTVADTTYNADSTLGAGWLTDPQNINGQYVKRLLGTGVAASAPTITNITTLTINGTATITGTGFPTSQTGSASVVVGGVSQSVTWNTSTSCTFTPAPGTNSLLTDVSAVVTDASGSSSSGYTCQFAPRSGGAVVTLSGTLASASLGLEASPALAAGDQIEYYGAVGGTIPGDVVVNVDRTYDTAASVTGFYWRPWSSGAGWGTAAFETVTHAAESSGDTGALFKTMMGSLFKTLLEAS